MSIPLLFSKRGFHPRQLFAALQGAWLEPVQGSIWQENTGVTPTTTGGQTIGLMLDQSQGAVLGPELVTNGAFDSDTAWTKGTGWSISGGVGVGSTTNGSISQDISVASGKFYAISGRIVSLSAGTVRLLADNTTMPIVNASSPTTFAYIVQTSSTTMTFGFRSITGFTGTVDNCSVREILGNHAAQSTAANRPLLGRRYNLLTYSEDFSNAIWSRQQLGTGSAPAVTQNYAAAPDGTTTAARIILDRGAGTTASDYSYISQRSSVVVGSSYTGTFWVKLTSGSTPITIQAGDGGTFNNVTVTSSWQQITNTIITNGGTRGIGIINIGNVGAAQSADILVWHPDYRPTADVGKDPAYQRITTATDYDYGQYPAAVHDATDSLVVSLPDLGGGVFSAPSYALVENSNSYNSTGITLLNADVYICVDSGDIYKQTGGTGNFSALSQTSRRWYGMTTHKGDVYACVYGGDIYKQTGGAGNFVGLGQTSRNWNALYSDGIDIYASVDNGDIYKSADGTGTFTGLGQTSRRWAGLCKFGGDFYATTLNAGIFKQTAGVGAFESWYNNGLTWTDIKTLNGYLYACVSSSVVNGGGVYRLVQAPSIWEKEVELISSLNLAVSSSSLYAAKSSGGGVYVNARPAPYGSVYFATPVGMSALHNQSMGTSFTLPALSSDIYSWIVVPQRLSTVLENRLARYMERRAGIAGPDAFEQVDYGPEIYTGQSFTPTAGGTYDSGTRTFANTQINAFSYRPSFSFYPLVAGKKYLIAGQFSGPYSRVVSIGTAGAAIFPVDGYTTVNGSGSFSAIVTASTNEFIIWTNGTSLWSGLVLESLSIRELKDGMTGQLLDDNYEPLLAG